MARGYARAPRPGQALRLPVVRPAALPGGIVRVVMVLHRAGDAAQALPALADLHGARQLLAGSRRAALVAGVVRERGSREKEHTQQDRLHLNPPLLKISNRVTSASR